MSIQTVSDSQGNGYCKQTKRITTDLPSPPSYIQPRTEWLTSPPRKL